MNKIISLFALLTILSIFSCKDDEVESDMGTTNSLYLRFEIGGEQKEYTSLQAFWGGGTSTNGMDTYGTLWGFDGEIRIDFSQDAITLNDLLNLEGKTIPFGEGDPINAVFVINDQDEIEADSYRIVDHRSTSTLKVTEVYQETAVNNPFGIVARVIGTFQTEIEDVYSPERHEITNGEFSLIFQGAE